MVNWLPGSEKQLGRRAEDFLLFSSRLVKFWWWNACRERSNVFCKKCKKRAKFDKIWLFGSLAPFLNDVSMTSPGGSRLDDVSMMSSGDVAAYDRSMGAVRWRIGGRVVGRGRGRAADTGGERALTSADRWRDIGPPPIRRRICQRGLRWILEATRGPRMTSASDRYRTISSGRRGRSEIYVDRWIRKAWSDGYRARDLHGGYDHRAGIK